MRQARIQIVLGLAVLAAMLAGVDLPAQTSGPRPARRQAQRGEGDSARTPRQPAGQRRHCLGRWQPGERGRRVRALFARVAALPPGQQKRALEEDEFFRRMPPMAQERFRRRLHVLNQLPAEQRRKALENMQRFAQLSPERQRQLHRRARIFQRMTPEQRLRAQRIFRAWQELPSERRQLLRSRLSRMQQAEPAARRALLENPAFLGPLVPGERRLLRGLWMLRQVLPPGDEP